MSLQSSCDHRAVKNTFPALRRPYNCSHRNVADICRSCPQIGWVYAIIERLRVLLPAPQLSLHAHYPYRPSPGCWVYLRSSNTRPAHFVFRPYNCRRYLQVLSPNRLSICDHRAVLECYYPSHSCLYRPIILAGQVIAIIRLSPISISMSGHRLTANLAVQRHSCGPPVDNV